MTRALFIAKITPSKPNTMVIQMARTYVQTTWNDADKFAYNGAQQHFKPNGAANPKAYEEKPVEKKNNKVKAPDYRTLDQKREDTLDRKRVQFEKAFENGEISFDQYNLLLTEWEKAMSRLEKRMGVVKEEPSSTTPSTKPSIMNTVEDAAKGFAARHPFTFLVASIMVGAGVLNIFGFGG